MPGAVEGLTRLKQLGLPLVVVTNQSGLGRGYFNQQAFEAVHARFEALLAEQDLSLAGMFYCPHHPQADCPCRKPAPGLGLEAARQLGLTPERALVVGDKESDVEFGRNLGAAMTCLVGSGPSQADHCVSDLGALAALIDARAGHDRV